MQKLQNSGSITLKGVCGNTSEIRCENETWLGTFEKWYDELN